MLTLEEIKDFKIEKRKVILPKPIDNKGNLIFLPYLKPKDSVHSIRSSSGLFVRQNNWKFIFRDYMYNYKLFKKNFHYNTIRERDSIIDEYETDKSVKGVRNLSLVKNKNCYIDLSEYMNNFFNFKRPSWKITISEFFRLTEEILNREEYKDFNSKIILLNTTEWEVSKTDLVNKYNILNNPFSIFYLAMRKSIEEVRKLGEVTIIITDGFNSFFKFIPSKLENDSYLDFKLAISKIKTDMLDKDLDNDTHLNTFGTTSSNAPESELERARAANSVNGEQDFSSDEKEKKSLMDRLDELKGGSNSEDDEEDELDLDSEENDDEEEPSEPKSKETSTSKTDNEDEDIESEILDEFEIEDEETVAKVKDILVKKDPSRPISAREKKLKEEQLKIKLSSGKTLKEILYDAKNSPSNMKIETIDVGNNVHTMNTNLTKISYPNFEKEYNEKVFEHDLYAIFDDLSKRPDLPVYIRKVTKTDTSDSLNLKDTYKFELEDTTYHRRHTFTVDVPKFIEGKFMYLGGNKKIFIKQLILKPIVKIAPDTVQICSNYNKIFMYRYGDNSSPLLQNLIRLINLNTKIFKIKKGDGVPFNKEYKTTIEYDILAKTFLELKIKNFNGTFYFSQKAIEDYIKANGLEDVLKSRNINPDKELIVAIVPDLKDKKKTQFITIDTDDAVMASTGFNNGEDLDPSGNTNSTKNIIDLIIQTASQANPDFQMDKEFTEIGTKIGKRYIYSRCKIMKRFVPTALLLAYCEGLSTLLEKAKVNYSFSKDRPRFANPSDKLKQGVIPFANGYLVFDRYPIQNSLLLNSFSLIDTKAYNFEDMNDKGTYLDILGSMYNSRILASAFDSFYDNMIDPITREILDTMNYPTEFVPLLLMANTLLADNNFSSEINMENFRVRSNEMVNGILYKLVANAFSKYKRTVNNKTPMKISIPPNALIKEIVTSQSVEDYSILNPIVECEKSRAITCKGPSGINLDESYTEEKRSFDKSMTGLVSMSTSPDANCGVVRELTLDPKIISPRGFIDIDKSIDDMSDGNLFSVAEMATPLGVTRDDSIRTAMASKQSEFYALIF